jgi:hypothetical protein
MSLKSSSATEPTEDVWIGSIAEELETILALHHAATTLSRET